MILAIYVSFSAFVCCFLTCCVVPELTSQVSTAQIGRKLLFFPTCSNHKKQYLPGCRGCAPPCRKIPFKYYFLVFNHKRFWLTWNSTQNEHDGSSAGVLGERRGKQLWLVVCLSSCVQRRFWLRPLVLPLGNERWLERYQTNKKKFGCARLTVPT